MRGPYQAGFSLLELLVALFVVVIITSLVTLAVNSGGGGVELEARAKSLADISGFALDEAQMRGVDMGLLIERIDREGEQLYRFSWRERMPQGWRRPEVDRDIFAGRAFPAGIELALELEDTPVEIMGEAELAVEQDGKISEPEPQVVFYTSGEVTVGFIDLRQTESGELLWRIAWDLLGRFTLLRRGESVDE